MIKALRSKIIASKITSKLAQAGISIEKGSKAEAVIKSGAKLASDNWETVEPLIQKGEEIIKDLKKK